MRVIVLLVSAWLLVLSFSLSDTARAEEAEKGLFYIGIYGGLAYPEDLQNVTRLPAGTQLRDRKVDAIMIKDPDTIFGAKFGFIPEEEYTWFGVEAEYFITSTELLPAGGLSKATLEVRALSLNFVLRYARSWIQPYLGVGPSLVWADSFQLEGKGSTITTSGLNLLAGLRIPIADRIMLFTEYKHNRANLDFSNFNVDYRLHAGVGGIGIMF